MRSKHLVVQGVAACFEKKLHKIRAMEHRELGVDGISLLTSTKQSWPRTGS